MLGLCIGFGCTIVLLVLIALDARYGHYNENDGCP